MMKIFSKTHTITEKNL